MILADDGFEACRGQYELDVATIKRFLTRVISRSCFLVGMIKIDERDIHFLSESSKVMMVELAHLSAFIFWRLLKEYLLYEFESFLIEQFLILIGSFLLPALLNDLIKDQSFIFGQLLKLAVVESLVVEIHAENGINIQCGFRSCLLFFQYQRQHLIRKGRMHWLRSRNWCELEWVKIKH